MLSWEKEEGGIVVKARINTAIVQLCSGPVVQDNLVQVESLLEQYLDNSTDLIVLPECFAQMGGNMVSLGQDTQPVREWLSSVAKQYQAWVVGGSIPYDLHNGENCRASCFVYDPVGQEVERYDKIHLFDVDVEDNTHSYRESDDYSPGQRVVMVDMGFAKTGLSICYDLRFPELYRLLAGQGAGLITVPSAFTRATGEAHWETLLRARAIENQCFVLAANQGGVHPNGRETWGHSIVISPWGEILAQAGESPCVLTVELDLSVVDSVRASMPCLSHKRL